MATQQVCSSHTAAQCQGDRCHSIFDTTLHLCARPSKQFIYSLPVPHPSLLPPKHPALRPTRGAAPLLFLSNTLPPTPLHLQCGHVVLVNGSWVVVGRHQGRLLLRGPGGRAHSEEVKEGAAGSEQWPLDRAGGGGGRQ
jgi:hypothetical protein